MFVFLGMAASYIAPRIMTTLPLFQLDEMEKSREETLDDYQKFSEQKIKQYVDENKVSENQYTLTMDDLSV